jgi:hypothetical protein
VITRGVVWSARQLALLALGTEHRVRHVVPCG